MTDITMCSDMELSLHFGRIEYLYNVARKATHFNQVKDVADQYFIYNQVQLNELESDFDDGLFE